MESQALAVVIFFLSAFILGYIWVRLTSDGNHSLVGDGNHSLAGGSISKSVYREPVNKYVREGAGERIRRRMQKNKH